MFRLKEFTGSPNIGSSLPAHLKKIIYLFLERGEGRERNINVRNIHQLPLTRPQLGTWPATQACALTGNGTTNISLCGTMPSQLSHTGQGVPALFTEPSSSILLSQPAFTPPSQDAHRCSTGF